MEKSFKTAIEILLLLVLVVVFIYFIDPNLFRWITEEDGLIEYLTALLLLIISICLLVKVIKNKRKKSRVWIVFNILMSVGLFFGFGEEISWGQRLFNIVPSDFFIEHNAQKETNLHNLKINGIKINKWVFTYLFSVVFGVYFFLLLFGYKKIEQIKNYVDKLGVPVPKIKHMLIFTLISIPIFSIPIGDKWELWECLFAVMLLSIFIEPYNVDEKLLPKETRIQNKTL